MTDVKLTQPVQPVEEEAIEFGEATPGHGSQTILGQIKARVVKGLEKKGMPGTLYVAVFSLRPSEQECKDMGITLIEAHPTLSTKDGRVMYNYGNKVTVGNGVDARCQGNIFLPKEGFTAPPAAHAAFKAAKEQQAKDREINKAKLAKETEAMVLDAGEEV